MGVENGKRRRRTKERRGKKGRTCDMTSRSSLHV